MKIGHSVDANGFLIGDVLESSGVNPDVTDLCPSDGFYKPKWNGAIWVEGLTQAEMDAIRNAPKPPDPDIELADAIQAADTLDELKKALLGNNGNLARVKGKMK